MNNGQAQECINKERNKKGEQSVALPTLHLSVKLTYLKSSLNLVLKPYSGSDSWYFPPGCNADTRSQAVLNLKNMARICLKMNQHKTKRTFKNHFKKTDRFPNDGRFDRKHRTVTKQRGHPNSQIQ
jgi:hypothetical protein